MTAKIHYDEQTSLEPLRGSRIAVLGYGSQGRAHALNLHDSGLDVTVGLRKDSPTRSRVEQEGLRAAPIADACADADVIALLLPDQHQPSVYRDAIEPALRSGTALVFAHGFNIHYGQIRPPKDNDVVMVGPKAPGPMLRRAYEQGRGVPAVVAVEQDATGRAIDLALAYAKGVGCTRAGVIETTFAEETETDLFGEQAVLAGGVSHLIQAGFDTLVEAGYQPEIAYFECLHEMKLVVDLIYDRGLEGMRAGISDTAEYGSLTRGKQVIGSAVREQMRRVLEDIRSGAFAREWVDQTGAAARVLEAERERASQHPIEAVGARLKAMLPLSSE